jgi:hypothetical protein
MLIQMNYFTEKEGIELFSNPKVVQKKAKEYGLNVVYSPRKNKKYRIVNPETNKYVDFGFYGMQDFTLHKDEERRQKFLSRNRRFKDAPKYSASWLSYYLLW